MRKQFGLSLVELMISITLGLILMTGVMKLFLSSKLVFSTQQGLSRIQETGRLAMNFLSHDISEAAYYGCHRPIASDDNLKLQGMVAGNDKTFNTDFAIGVMGYDSAANSKIPEDALPDTVIDNVASRYANILVLRSASRQGLILNGPNSATALTAFTTESFANNCISGVCNGGVAVVADCSRSRVFRVSSVSEPSSNITTVKHPDSWGGADQVMENFGSGAEILPFSTTAYFLANSSSGVGSSLWQRTNDNDPFELLEGVEQMRITYALASSPGVYQAASAYTDTQWPQIWSVRVELLVRSIEDNILSEAQPFTFGESPTPVTPPDRRMRQVFTVTTAIRSRMTLN